jgi:hypothetical protein
MAIVLGGYSGIVTLVDQGANTVHKKYDLREPTVYADALADLQTIVGLLTPITDAVVRGYVVHAHYVEDTFAYPTGGTQIENLAEFVLRLDTDEYKTAIHTVPAPDDDIFINSAGPGYNTVDPTGDVYAYINGVFGPTGVAYISDGETTPTSGVILSGKRVHRASRKG